MGGKNAGTRWKARKVSSLLIAHNIMLYVTRKEEIMLGCMYLFADAHYKQASNYLFVDVVTLILNDHEIHETSCEK